MAAVGVRRFDAGASADRFLVERMVEPPLAELLVGVRTDPRFGLAMTLASGGVLTELVADAVTILLPASRVDLEEALGRLRMSRLLDGFRGAAPATAGCRITNGFPVVRRTDEAARARDPEPSTTRRNAIDTAGR